MSDGIVIAGGGLAAQRCCETLRGKGYDGPIRVLSEEKRLPYDRPPLSKEVLTGDMPPAATAFRPRGWYDAHGVDVLLGTRATRLDIAASRVEVSSGRPLRYEHLLIATGAAPRLLPVLEGYDNVTTLRTRTDAERLARALHPGARVVIVGAGFIGLEVAASARALGAEVTVVEAAPAPLAAVLGDAIGMWFANLHRAEGVNVLLSTQIESVTGARNARELRLKDGQVVHCDHVLVGVGVEPATRWLHGSGLDTAGVIVDGAGRTGAPGVYAAGDVARVHDVSLGRPMRSEHWEAAARQGAAVGRAMLGLGPSAMPPASFWSDQYGTRIQYVGHASEADRTAIEGDPDSRDFTVDFTRAGATVAALLVGRPRDLPQARRRVQTGLESLVQTATRSAA